MSSSEDVKVHVMSSTTSSASEAAEVKALKQRVEELEKVKRDLAKLTVELRKVGREYRDKAAALEAEKAANGGQFGPNPDTTVTKEVHEAELATRDATIKELKFRLQTAQNDLAALKATKSTGKTSRLGYHSPTQQDDDIQVLSDADVKKEEEMSRLRTQVQITTKENEKLLEKIKELKSAKSSEAAPAAAATPHIGGVGGVGWPFQSPFMSRDRAVSGSLISAKEKEIEALGHRIRDLKKGLEEAWLKGNALEKEVDEYKRKLETSDHDKKSLQEFIEAGQKCARELWKALKCGAPPEIVATDVPQIKQAVNGSDKALAAENSAESAKERAAAEAEESQPASSYFKDKPKLLESGPEDRAASSGRKRGSETSPLGQQKRFRTAAIAVDADIQEIPQSELRTLSSSSSRESGGAMISRAAARRKRLPPGQLEGVESDAFQSADGTFEVPSADAEEQVTPVFKSSRLLADSAKRPLGLLSGSSLVGRYGSDDFEPDESDELVSAQMDALMARTRKDIAIALHYESLLYDRSHNAHSGGTSRREKGPNDGEANTGELAVKQPAAEPQESAAKQPQEEKEAAAVESRPPLGIGKPAASDEHANHTQTVSDVAMDLMDTVEKKLEGADAAAEKRSEASHVATAPPPQLPAAKKSEQTPEGKEHAKEKEREPEVEKAKKPEKEKEKEPEMAKEKEPEMAKENEQEKEKEQEREKEKELEKENEKDEHSEEAKKPSTVQLKQPSGDAEQSAEKKAEEETAVPASGHDSTEEGDVEFLDESGTEEAEAEADKDETSGVMEIEDGTTTVVQEESHEGATVVEEKDTVEEMEHPVVDDEYLDEKSPENPEGVEQCMVVVDEVNMPQEQEQEKTGSQIE